MTLLEPNLARKALLAVGEVESSFRCRSGGGETSRGVRSGGVQLAPNRRAYCMVPQLDLEAPPPSTSDHERSVPSLLLLLQRPSISSLDRRQHHVELPVEELHHV